MKQPLLLLAGLLALALAVLLYVRHARSAAAESTDFPDGVAFVCRKPGCGAGFSMPLADMAALYQKNPDAPIVCPRCGSEDTARGVKCPDCGGFFERQSGPAARSCPLCKKRLPALTSGG